MHTILTMYSFTKFCTVFVLLQIAQASSSDCELKISHLVQSLQGCANAHSQQCDDTKQPAPLPSSCQDIYTKWPNSPSGFYQIGDKSRSSPVYVYCNMDELCGSKGGWTRQAYLDMSDSSSTCPAGFKLYQSDGVRACGRQTSNVGSCQSVKFNTYGNYSQVCGKVIGYQYHTPDAIYPGNYTNEEYGSVIDSHHNNINSYYVDGVSITHGSPRQHIWTLIAGILEASIGNDGYYNCPFSDGSLQNTSIQTFVGNDYFCESGIPGTTKILKKLYTKDPLWDGKGCGILETNICSNKGQPWFNKKLSNVTNDYIELRVCDDQSTADEDNPVTYYEIYTK